MEAHYVLECTACGSVYRDDGFRLRCDGSHPPALLRTRYALERFEPMHRSAGIGRYRRWLPLRRSEVPDASLPAIYKSEGLARLLGLRELWIAFNGYWPQRGVMAPTGTFKDLEAAAVVARMSGTERILVAASAGNTASALALACARAGVRLCMVVPERVAEWLRWPMRANGVRLVTVGGDASYDDAIAWARLIAEEEPFVWEGGIWNVARRDGIGVTLLAAVETIGRLPSIYVQGIGSGAGAVAVYEAARRLVADGRFGSRLPRMVLAQNAPLAPVVEAWSRRSATIVARDPAARRLAASALAAPVLGAAAPPYEIVGGVREVLDATDGLTYAVENDEIHAMARSFAEVEGVRIETAAAAAVAALSRAVGEHAVDPEASILLHITGGGRDALPDDGFARARIAASVSPGAAVGDRSVLQALRERLAEAQAA